jgi:HSP20 family protein
MAAYPPVNLGINDHGVKLTAEVPGIDLEDLDVTLHGNTITVAGKRAADPLEEGEAYARNERPHGEFSRTIELPFDVSSETAEAAYEKGVLTLLVQRPEEQKPKRLSIKAG